jgi:uncharacterized repeat protein (TIGR01451 family)
MNKLTKILQITLLIFLTACATDSSRKSTTTVQTAQAKPQEPAPSRGSLVCGEATGGLVGVAIAMPSEAVLGNEFTYTINVKAAACAANVVVTDLIPAGASLVRAEPPARPEEGRLRWNLGDLDKDQAMAIKVTLKSEKDGMLASCASVSADPRVCAQIFIGKAALVLKKTGPETAVIGQPITYVITIANNGTMVAKDVVIVDEAPEGMISVTDRTQATIQVGDLTPGQTKTYSIAAKGLKKGNYCNYATAKSSNAGEAKAEACTTFQQPGIKLAKDGPKEQFLTRAANYKIVVSNTGETPLTGVTVTDTAPEGTTIASAPGANVTGNKAVWNVGNMRAGEEKSLAISLTGTVPGNHCNKAMVATTEGLTGSAEACTVWTGVGALLLEVLDNPDPIQIGENTTYKVRITNQGTADDTNIKVVVDFTAELDPVSASNGGTVSGKTVTFPPFARLGPKQAFEYTISAKGVKAGDARPKFVRTSDGIPAPTSAEESTRVY